MSNNYPNVEHGLNVVRFGAVRKAKGQKPYTIKNGHLELIPVVHRWETLNPIDVYWLTEEQLKKAEDIQNTVDAMRKLQAKKDVLLTELLANKLREIYE